MDKFKKKFVEYVFMEIWGELWKNDFLKIVIKILNRCTSQL